MQHGVGDLVWIYPHETYSWVPGEIKRLESDSYIVAPRGIPDDSLYRVDKDKALPVHPSCLAGVPDLLQLGDFNEGALLHNVRERYFHSHIYTSVGAPILISINPYARLPIYSNEIAAKFRGLKELERAGRAGELPPHLFLMAESAYSSLRDANQSIIISGESGAGKTEAAKIILRYLATISTEKRGPKTGSMQQQSIEKQVLDSNPLLEAFGNAKTLRNDNSSRFGKFIEIHFDAISQKLLSARIDSYLLEKSRLVTQQIGERNYHFFYQLCAGASAEEAANLHIYPAESYAYLTKGECLVIEGVDDAAEYQKTRACIEGLGFTVEDQMQLLRIVAGILHLGNIEFEGETEARIVDNEPFDLCGELLGLESAVLMKILVKRTMVDPQSRAEIVMDQTPAQAAFSRDAIAKALYERLFTWIVLKVNLAIAVPLSKQKTSILGLLDIYGFEVFETNSFEQFCINYANEKLQQHFNQHMFKMEQAEYSREKIKWDHIEYEDNQDTIDLIEKKPLSIIALLDEYCRFGTGTDTDFLTSIMKKIQNKHLTQPGKFSRQFFGVVHYAGEVYYSASGFIEKNKDNLSPDIATAMESSTLEIIRMLFVDKAKKPQGKKKEGPGSLATPTLATQFKGQLHDLMKTLSAATPSYIRCIKPNSNKQPREFDSGDVQRQLRCAGMLESIRIRKSGYAVRRTIPEFIGRYRVLAPGKALGSIPLTTCKNIFAELLKKPNLRELVEPEKRLWQIGVSFTQLTKVFMKDDLRLALDLEYVRATKQFATRIQAAYRGYRARFRFMQMIASARCLQVRGIQANVRRWLFIRRMRHARGRKLAARRVVSAVKSRLSRVVIKRRLRSISIIQRIWRTIRLQRSKRRPVPSPARPLAPPADPDIHLSEAEERFSHIEIPEERVSTLQMGPPRTTMDTISSELNAFSAQLAEERSLRMRAEREKDLVKAQFEDLKSQYERLNVENSQLALKKAVGIDKESMELLTSNLFEHLDRPEPATNDAEFKRLQGDIASKDREMSILRLKLESFERKMRDKEEEVREARENEGNTRAQVTSQAEEILQLKRQVKGDLSSDGLKELKQIKAEFRQMKADLRGKEEILAKVRAESASELDSLRTDYEKVVIQLKEKSAEIANLASTYKGQVESIQKANLDHSSARVLPRADLREGQGTRGKDKAGKGTREGSAKSAPRQFAPKFRLFRAQTRPIRRSFRSVWRGKQG